MITLRALIPGLRSSVAHPIVTSMSKPFSQFPRFVQSLPQPTSSLNSRSVSTLETPRSSSMPRAAVKLAVFLGGAVMTGGAALALIRKTPNENRDKKREAEEALRYASIKPF